MNIFVLDDDHKKSAAALCDVHLTKMPLESVQILNTALHLNGAGDLAFYGEGYVNHPCCTWAAESAANWLWLHEYTRQLGKRFERERGKTHASVEKLLDNISITTVCQRLPAGERTDPPQCMPDECKADDVVTAYRNYYRDVKSHEEWFDIDTCANTEWKTISR